MSAYTSDYQRTGYGSRTEYRNCPPDQRLTPETDYEIKQKERIADSPMGFNKMETLIARGDC
jgi:hypothetical protein